jgi:LysR family transcriptional activator of nhaA
MDNWLNYHHLIYFKTIAQEGSISNASKILKVGQPALSSQLKNFEEYLGIKLFDRVNNRLQLTEAGKMTLEFANKIDGLGKELLATIKNKKLQSSYHLTIGALDSIPKHLILDVINVAKKKFNCHFTIIEGDINSLMNELETHNLDIILSDHTVTSNSESRIYCQKFLTQKIAAYCNQSYIEIKENFPGSLNSKPVILPTDHSQLRFQIDQYALKNDLDYEVIAQTQDTAVKKLMAIRGEGIVFLSEIAALEFVKNKQLYEVGTLEDVSIDFYLISSERVIKNAALKSIIEQNFDDILDNYKV